MIELKRCIVCRRVKAVDQFYRREGNKDDLRGNCKKCQAAYQEAHQEERVAYNRAHYSEHREEIAAYREEHREELRAYQRAYRAKHREELLAKQRTYRKANPEKVAAKNHRYYASHREEQAAYRAEHREKINAKNRRRRALKREATVGEVDYEAIKKRDRMICCVCGKRVAEKDLSFDHTIPLSLGGPHTQGNLRVCHRRCNSRRGAGRLPAQMVLV